MQHMLRSQQPYVAHLLSTPMKSVAESAVLRLGVRAPQGMRCMRLREGVFSPLLDDPPPSKEGRSLLALLGGFFDALVAAACGPTWAHIQQQI